MFKRGNTKNTVRILIAVLISILPTNGLRCLAYRLLFGYDIRNAQLGFGAVIAVEKVRLHGCRIGKMNRLIGPMTISIGKNAVIGPFNEFDCGGWTLDQRYSDSGYKRYLEIGEGAVVSARHHFDIAGALVIGSQTWIAGRGSQFWTHGAGVKNRDIHIGKNCYIASAVRFAPGAVVNDHCLVGIGSVVVGAIKETHALIGGVPAKVLKQSYDWKALIDEDASSPNRILLMSDAA